jgi:hypothetical protein
VQKSTQEFERKGDRSEICRNVSRSENPNVGGTHYMDEYEKKGVAKWVPGKYLKRKNEYRRGVSSRKGIVGVHPGRFCASGQQSIQRIRNLEECARHRS